MTLTNNSLKMLKIISFFQKTITNPYVGICISLVLILPSLYVILGDYTVMRKEYIFLAIGIPLYVKSLNKIFDEILNGD
jgi:hypothetical protein